MLSVVGSLGVITSIVIGAGNGALIYGSPARSRPAKVGRELSGSELSA
jgi:hypothetical protein